MGLIVNREAILVCDDCGKKEKTTTASKMYGFKALKVGDCYQDGSGANQDYKLINQKELVLCDSCYQKRMGDL